MNCTHGGTAMNIALGDRCPWCLKIVVELSTLATRGGEEVGSVVALETYSHLPAAHIAVRSVPILAGLPAPETTPPVVVSGAPIATPKPLVVERKQTARLVADAQGVLSAAEPRLGRVATPEAPNRHARNTDPDTAHDAALSVADAHKRRLYDHILALIFEHGPLTDWQLSRFLTVRIGEPVIATSAGKRRGELRDMGLLFDTGFRGPTETGPKKAVRWGLTPAGEMEVAA